MIEADRNQSMLNRMISTGPNRSVPEMTYVDLGRKRGGDTTLKRLSSGRTICRLELGCVVCGLCRLGRTCAVPAGSRLIGIVL